ncbi:hypothetical protein WICPIJ_005871 [Wickerhamomyces pijperi]|uniref:Prefoldin subunit 4 n=1 Tax=Wickerhamomyces pijperi TaxID=599730 RepID=A0A9P8Q5H7_WICPI|nr:hypothetical protein WICPIJ_005871 [Wickerhamomyces pijperi]
MELLPEGQQNQIEVLFDDQMKINEFSKLIQRKDTLQAQLKKEQQEKEFLEDVSLEIELLDEDELVNYRLTKTAFVKMKQSKLVEKLEEDGEALDFIIRDLDQQLDDIEDRLGELKKDLYTKFGDNINLER